MAAPPPPPPARGTMSLYADLLGGGSAESETTAPAAAVPEAAKSSALRFQPIIRRPQQTNKAKAKPKMGNLSSANNLFSNTSIHSTTQAASPAATALVAPSATTAVPGGQAHPPARTSLADWTRGDGGDEDDFYDDDDGGGGGGGGGAGGGPKWSQRGGRKRKKKRLEEKQQHQRTAARDTYVDWDELYDPARPTNLDAYLHSDERIEAARDWKAVLYAHRRAGRQKGLAARGSIDSSSSSSIGGGDDNDNDSDNHRRRRPPINNAFAPPPPAAFAPPVSYDRLPPAAQASSLPQPVLVLPQADGLVVSKPPIRFSSTADDEALDDGNGKENDVGYDPTPPETTADTQEPEERSASRPGQAGFAARLMAKYGWKRGTGLGANNSGIIDPLRHKRTGRTGAGGPAFGRIVGGDRAAGRQKVEDDTEQVSHVIVLRNMVTGLPDLGDEVAEGQLVQDIGEECGAQYGRVERVYIDVPGELVFIQFTEAVSALRAVNALNGRIFNGNAIVPSFYDADKFNEGVYE
ncbi:hypothetical protein SEPCBS57363_004676 [Sporothrix epigloea]|uniref:G-patch domain-containing protein n=1 Tax=Sporothrix epigloea TaxID=1892477 RepID=A0ABP0DXB6_9PEZI